MAHNQEVEGSNPSPAILMKGELNMNKTHGERLNAYKKKLKSAEEKSVQFSALSDNASITDVKQYVSSLTKKQLLLLSLAISSERRKRDI